MPTATRAAAKKPAAAVKAAPAQKTWPAAASTKVAATAKAPSVKTPPAPAKPAPVISPAAAGTKANKPRKKLVRDSFTMPMEDFALIAVLKARALDAKRPAKKSELLRSGVRALAALPPQQLVAALDALTPIKAGRPKRD